MMRKTEIYNEQEKDLLTITLLQTEIFWEDIDKNLESLSGKLSSADQIGDILVLPEMFTTGFSMNAAALAEAMDGKALAWMCQQAKTYQCVVTGSIIVKDGEHYYNRLIWMKPDCSYEKYDKKHLFSFLQEDTVFSTGRERVVVQWQGWKIRLSICYDLRFPVWLRNDPSRPYDLLLVVANWPEKRSSHWCSLLKARAIENQSYVVAVNRVGYDGHGIYHSGDSMCIAPNGEEIYHQQHHEDLFNVSVSKHQLLSTRATFPFLKDADKFTLHEAVPSCH